MTTKRCAWCAEPIAAASIRCCYCGSRVSIGLRNRAEWHRRHPARRVAGVCAALAHALRVPIAAVRVGFVLLALFHGLGLAIYAVLWFLLPDRPGARSGVDRIADAFRALIDEPRSAAPPQRAGLEVQDTSAGDSTRGCTPTRN
jgi:phage shock protein PspC (stress-responsive transcriptional regulator)